jgi:hypothetical protein
MFLFVLACSVSSSQKKVSEPITGVVDAKSRCDFEQRKQECIDQLVQIKGYIPQMVYSHPILSSPSGIDSVQKYLQIGEQQFIILSDSDWMCSGEIQVTGLLKEIDMGGPEGTRGSYRNYYISKSQIICL